MQFPRSFFRRLTQSEGKPANKNRRSFARRMIRWMLCRPHQIPKKSPKGAHGVVAARSQRNNIHYTGSENSPSPVHAVSAVPSFPPKEAFDDGPRQNGSQDTASGFTSTGVRADCGVQAEKKLPILYKGVEAVEAEVQEQAESSVPGDTLGHRHWLLERCNCWGWQSQQQQQDGQPDAYITPEVQIESHPPKGGRSPSTQSAKSEEASEEGPRGPAQERQLQRELEVEEIRKRLRERQLLFLSEKEKQQGSYKGWLLRCCGGPASGCSWALSFCTLSPAPTEADGILAEARGCASHAAIVETKSGKRGSNTNK